MLHVVHAHLGNINKAASRQNSEGPNPSMLKNVGGGGEGRVEVLALQVLVPL